MRLERLLQFNVAILSVLGTLLLGMGQGDLQLPAMALAAALVSLTITDGIGLFRLNRFVANVFAILAAIYSLSSFFHESKAQQLLSIASLLSYLQFILFFQEKSIRIYWQLMVLSLLQVVVASALALDLGAGLLLILYACVGVCALTLLFIHRETLRIFPESPKAPASTSRRRQIELRFEATPGVLARRLMTFQLIRQLFGMSLVTLAFAFVLFYASPRRGDSLWNMQGRDASRVGFSQEVSFRERGEIEQDDSPVLRIAFRDPLTDDPVRIVGEPYLRGAVLSRYVPDRQVWVTTQYLEKRHELFAAQFQDGLVRQEITLEPSAPAKRPDLRLLFAMYPVWRDTFRQQQSERLAFEAMRQQLCLAPSYEEQIGTARLRYSVLTDAIAAGRQRQVYEVMPSAIRYGRSNQHLLEVPLGQFSGLRQIANQVVAEQVKNPDDPLEVAFALRDYLKHRGGFSYTLDFSHVPRDPRLDPTEDFVVNHRRGHCEYFASALAIMLRTQNIPARLVIGFKGGDYNDVGDYYQVRQKHAHAWVEARIMPRFIKPELGLRRSALFQGAWLRLDATPALSAEMIARMSSTSFNKFDQFLDYFQFLWSDYVTGLSQQRQEDGIYQAIHESSDGKLNPEGIRMWLETFWHRLGLRSDSSRGFWRDWRILLVLCAVLFLAWRLRGMHASKRPQSRRVMGSVAKLIERVSPKLAKFLVGGRRGYGHDGMIVTFYQRLVTMLGGQGIDRLPGQTQREFAEMARRDLLRRQIAAPIAGIPVQLAAEFYRVRFGGATLDSREAETIEQALQDLEAQFNNQSK